MEHVQATEVTRVLDAVRAALTDGPDELMAYGAVDAREIAKVLENLTAAG